MHSDPTQHKMKVATTIYVSLVLILTSTLSVSAQYKVADLYEPRGCTTQPHPLVTRFNRLPGKIEGGTFKTIQTYRQQLRVFGNYQCSGNGNLIKENSCFWFTAGNDIGCVLFP